MTAPNLSAADLATAWVEQHRGELARAARGAGLPSRDLDGAAWLAALAAAERGEAIDASTLTAAAIYAICGRPLIARGHRGRARVLPLVRMGAARDDEVAVTSSLEQICLTDCTGGHDPLALLVASETISTLIDSSRWCANAAREAAGTPRDRVPDPSPRGAKTRQRKRARERAGQLTFGGWGWVA